MMMNNDLNRDQIALDAATAILPMYFEAIPGVQLKAKIQIAVRDAINLAAPAQGALPDALPRTWQERAAELIEPPSGEQAYKLLQDEINDLRAYIAQRAQQYTVSDAARLDFVYQLACVIPFIAPIATKEKWLEQIDVRAASHVAAIQAQAGDAGGGNG